MGFIATKGLCFWSHHVLDSLENLEISKSDTEEAGLAWAVLLADAVDLDGADDEKQRPERDFDDVQRF
jgi:hypothetical protein